MDPLLPWILAESRSQCEAQQAAQAEEEGSKEAGMSQPEVPTHGEPPGIPIGGSGESHPMKMVPDRERVLATIHQILGRLHALHLQTMHEMGSVREVDQILAQTLMAEFARLQLIVGEDLTKSLLALRSDLEASSEALMSDIVRTIGLHPNDPAAHQVKAVLHTFQQSTSMKVTLPLMELEAARGDMEEFMRSHLQELSLQTESRKLIGALSQKLADHSSRMQELVQAPELMEEEVSLQVIIGLGAHIPLEANFFPGVLEDSAWCLPVYLTHPLLSKKVWPAIGQPFLGSLSKGQREEILTSGKSQTLWCLSGSIWTMTWISKTGGLMT